MSLTRRSFAAAALTAPIWAQKTKPAENVPEATAEEAPLFTMFTRQVIAPTTVTKADGTYVNDLQPHEFRLIDRGREQKLAVEQATHPLSMVICIQANNTVESVLPTIKKIGPLLENTVLGEKGEAAIVAFDHRIRLMQDWTRDSDAITKALVKINPGSTTSAMNDAVSEACRMLKRRPASHRKVIMLISETRDKGSTGNTRQSLLDLQFGNVSLYSVNINRLVTSLLTKQQPARPPSIPSSARHMPAGALTTPDSMVAYTGHYTGSVVPLLVEIFRQSKSIFVDNQLETFTKYTGGVERSFLTLKDLERVIMDIGEELQSQYMISYSPNNTDQGGYHEIVVEVLRGPDYKVRTRDGYWMAAIPDHLR